MTHEEKTLFLFKLSVDTATTFRTAAMNARSGSAVIGNFDDRINELYDKFEEMLDQRLNKDAGK